MHSFGPAHTPLAQPFEQIGSHLKRRCSLRMNPSQHVRIRLNVGFDYGNAWANEWTNVYQFRLDGLELNLHHFRVEYARLPHTRKPFYWIRNCSTLIQSFDEEMGLTYGTSVLQIPAGTRINVSLTNLWYCGGMSGYWMRGTVAFNAWNSNQLRSPIGYNGAWRLCTLCDSSNVNSNWPVSLVLVLALVNAKQPTKHTIAIDCILLHTVHTHTKFKFDFYTFSFFVSRLTSRSHTFFEIQESTENVERTQSRKYNFFLPANLSNTVTYCAYRQVNMWFLISLSCVSSIAALWINFQFPNLKFFIETVLGQWACVG